MVFHHARRELERRRAVDRVRIKARGLLPLLQAGVQVAAEAPSHQRHRRGAVEQIVIGGVVEGVLIASALGQRELVVSVVDQQVVPHVHVVRGD